MRWRRLIPLPYFLAGVTVGVFIDRELGGSGGNSGLVAVVSAVSAAFALSGPLLQEKMRQHSEDAGVLRSEQRDHAVEIADTTLVWLGSTWFNPDTQKWSAKPAAESGLRVNQSGGGNLPVESLTFWEAATQHFEKDHEIAEAWRPLRSDLDARQRLKAEMDSAVDRRLREAIEGAFGSGFAPQYSHQEPAMGRTYARGDILEKLRGQIDVTQIVTDTITSNRGPELGSETRSRIMYGPFEFVTCTEPGVLDLDKFRATYAALRRDEEFRAKLSKVEEFDQVLRTETAVFAASAWSYYQRVKGSKRILGKCALCPSIEGDI